MKSLNLLLILFLSISTAIASFTEPPRLTSAQKNAIVSPAAGTRVYDTDLNLYQYYNGANWVATTDIQLDYDYSAYVATSGTVSAENVDWISSCTAMSAGATTCTLVSNYFSVAPNCQVTANGVGYVTNISAISTSSISIRIFDPAAGMAGANAPVMLNCQKTGTDYQSSNALISNNANFEWRDVTVTGLFTTNTTYAAKVRRIGEDAEFEVAVSFSGAPNASSLGITLPAGYVIDTAKMLASSSEPNTFGQGSFFDDSTGSRYLLVPKASLSTRVDWMYLVQASATFNNVTSTAPVTIAASDRAILRFRVPIVGWTNANFIVATLQGTPNVPGSTTKVDTVKINYGTTNATTVCSASPCSYLDQLGSGAVTSVTRSGTGAYTINFPRTYSKLKCTGNVTGAADAMLRPVSCTNCASLSFTTYTTAGSAADTYGLLDCTGE
jgi:hypothetical protein